MELPHILTSLAILERPQVIALILRELNVSILLTYKPISYLSLTSKETCSTLLVIKYKFLKKCCLINCLTEPLSQTDLNSKKTALLTTLWTWVKAWKRISCLSEKLTRVNLKWSDRVISMVITTETLEVAQSYSLLQSFSASCALSVLEISLKVPSFNLSLLSLLLLDLLEIRLDKECKRRVI